MLPDETQLILIYCLYRRISLAAFMMQPYIRRRIQIIIVIAWFLLLLPVGSSAAASWFREKYYKQLGEEYFVHTFSRLNLDGENDIDNCPEVHKPAIYFATTGRQLWSRVQRYQEQHHRRVRYESLNRNQYTYTPPEPYYLRLMLVTVEDLGWLMLDIIRYSFNLLMIQLSIVMATLTTLVLGILVFGQ